MEGTPPKENDPVQELAQELKARLEHSLTKLEKTDRGKLLDWIRLYESEYLPALMVSSGDRMASPVFELSDRLLAYAYIDILRELIVEDLPKLNRGEAADKLRRQVRN